MRGFAAASILLSLCACASTGTGQLRTPEDRTLAARTCPPPGSPEQNQATLAAWPTRFVDAVAANETLAYGPTRIIWVHPPDPVLARCR